MSIKKIIWLLIALGIIGCEANPVDLKSQRNFLKGITQSKKLDKPILLHFTGFACMGYNEFYDDLLTSRKILNTLNEEFVTIELYVDDKQEIQINDTLNLHKIISSNYGNKRLKNAKTIGNINSIIQMDWLKSNSQPMYVITDSERNILVEPFGYTRKNRKYFLAKLEEGLKKFQTMR